MGEGLATFVVGCRCLCTKQTNPFTRSSAFQNSEQGWGGVRGESSRKPERREERRRRRKKKKKKEEEEERRRESNVDFEKKLTCSNDSDKIKAIR